MAAAERYVVPEIHTDEEWLHLTNQVRSPLKTSLRPVKEEHQLLVIDVFSSWSGPCAAMETYLKRLRHQFVQMPDCLALAKACADNIEFLQPFLNEPRPTFLFWARSRVVALMRGAHRPLLTRLVQHEAETEAEMRHRSDSFVVDLKSNKVIQCEEDTLARLNEDEVVNSIGNGYTERLTDFFAPEEEEQKPSNKSEDGNKENLDKLDEAKNEENEVADKSKEDEMNGSEQEDESEGEMTNKDILDPDRVDLIDHRKCSLDAGLLKEILSVEAKANANNPGHNVGGRMKRSASKHGYP